MEMQELVKMLVNSGVSIAVIAYFMYRDFKFMGELQTVLQSLVSTTNNLKDIIIAHNSNSLVD